MRRTRGLGAQLRTYIAFKKIAAKVQHITANHVRQNARHVTGKTASVTRCQGHVDKMRSLNRARRGRRGREPRDGGPRPSLLACARN